MTQPLPDAELNFVINTSSYAILATADDVEFGYKVEVDLKYFDKRKQRTKHVQLLTESKK